jgi:hypothetical protein
MKIPSRFDSSATVGALFLALATALPCCLPLLASTGAALGLGFLAPYQGVLNWLLQAFIALALMSHIQSYGRHRNPYLLGLAAVSATALFYAYNIEIDAAWVYGGFAGLAAAAIWNYQEIRRRGSCHPSIRTHSTLTCPQCGRQTLETMPTDACQYFYECPACKTLLKPKAGDCCVFCSYGDVPCPPRQAGSSCCA